MMCYVSTEEVEERGWEKDVGLSEGVDMRAVLWALMSQSAGSLLDACMALVGSIFLCNKKVGCSCAKIMCTRSHLFSHQVE